MQPEGRVDSDEGFITLTTQDDCDWTELRIGGANGIVNVVGALTWWYKGVHALPKENASKTGRSGQKRKMEMEKLYEALDDVFYVFKQLLH